VSSTPRRADQASIRENKLTLVERLADDLAHEIKNPLHSMVINLEVLRRRLARLENGGGQELLRYAGVLSSELERVNHSVDLLLWLVRPNRDCDEPTTLFEVLEELRELVELECERNRVALRMELPTTLARARLPGAATRQMLLSLFLRALDDAGRGGTLQVTFAAGPERTQLQFSGTGPAGGLSNPPLSTGDGSYLAVARELAERLGGSVEVVVPSHVADGRAGPGATGYVLSLPTEV
jgi:signal transduction histidine kinase